MKSLIIVALMMSSIATHSYGCKNVRANGAVGCKSKPKKSPKTKYTRRCTTQDAEMEHITKCSTRKSKPAKSKPTKPTARRGQGPSMN